MNGGRAAKGPANIPMNGTWFHSAPSIYSSPLININLFSLFLHIHIRRLATPSCSLGHKRTLSFFYFFKVRSFFFAPVPLKIISDVAIWDEREHRATSSAITSQRWLESSQGGGMAFRFAPHYHLQARAQRAASITINYSIYNIHVSYSDKAPYYCLWDFLFFVYPE